MEIDNSYFYQSIAFTFKNPDINEKARRLYNNFASFLSHVKGNKLSSLNIIKNCDKYKKQIFEIRKEAALEDDKSASFDTWVTKALKKINELTGKNSNLSTNQVQKPVIKEEPKTDIPVAPKVDISKPKKRIPFEKRDQYPRINTEDIINKIKTGTDENIAPESVFVPTVEAMNMLFDTYNRRYFNGVLAKIPFKIREDSPAHLGCYVSTRDFANKRMSPQEIYINKRFVLNFGEFRDTFVHELTHYYATVYAKPPQATEEDFEKAAKALSDGKLIALLNPKILSDNIAKILHSDQEAGHQGPWLKKATQLNNDFDYLNITEYFNKPDVNIRNLNTDMYTTYVCTELSSPDKGKFVTVIDNDSNSNEGKVFDDLKHGKISPNANVESLIGNWFEVEFEFDDPNMYRALDPERNLVGEFYDDFKNMIIYKKYIGTIDKKGKYNYIDTMTKYNKDYTDKYLESKASPLTQTFSEYAKTVMNEAKSTDVLKKLQNGYSLDDLTDEELEMLNDMLPPVKMY